MMQKMQELMAAQQKKIDGLHKAIAKQRKVVKAKKDDWKKIDKVLKMTDGLNVEKAQLKKQQMIYKKFEAKQQKAQAAKEKAQKELKKKAKVDPKTGKKVVLNSTA